MIILFIIIIKEICRKDSNSHILKLFTYRGIKKKPKENNNMKEIIEIVMILKISLDPFVLGFVNKNR